jgi:wzy protein
MIKSVRKNIVFLTGWTFPLIILPFSPLISFLASVFTLIFYSPFLGRVNRVLITSIGLFSLVYIFGSRFYIEEIKADLSIYYNAFLIIKKNPLSEVLFGFLIFGGGLEFGIVVLYKLYSFLFSDITAIDISIYNKIICSIGLLIWYEFFGQKRIPQEYKAICVAFILIFLSISTFGFLQRQALATIFVLFALEVKKKRYLIFFTILASIFHLTSLFIIFIWKYLLSKTYTNKIFIKSAFLFLIIRFLFVTIIFVAVPLGINKIVFYVEMMDTFAITSYRFLVLLFLLLVTTLLFVKNNSIKWKTPIIILSLFHIIFLGVPSLSERINFVFLYLYGYFLFVMLYKKFFKELCFLLFIYILYFTLEKMNITSLATDAFWSRYPVFSFEPFYYLNY